MKKYPFLIVLLPAILRMYEQAGRGGADVLAGAGRVLYEKGLGAEHKLHRRLAP